MAETPLPPRIRGDANCVRIPFRTSRLQFVLLRNMHLKHEMTCITVTNIYPSNPLIRNLNTWYSIIKHDENKTFWATNHTLRSQNVIVLSTTYRYKPSPYTERSASKRRFRPKLGNESILSESWNIDFHDDFTTHMLTFITSLKRGARFFWHVCTPAVVRHSLWLDVAASLNRFRIAVFKVNSKDPHVVYWAEGLISGMLSSDIGLSYTNKSS